MFEAWKSRVPPEADLVCYWFVKAGEQVASGRATRVGLVATNSIRGGANRRALQAATDGHPTFNAWSDEPWVVDDAAVRVSLVCFYRADDAYRPATRIDGEPADAIHSDLTASRGGAGIDLTEAKRIPANIGVAFMPEPAPCHEEGEPAWKRDGGKVSGEALEGVAQSLPKELQDRLPRDGIRSTFREPGDSPLSSHVRHIQTLVDAHLADALDTPFASALERLHEALGGNEQASRSLAVLSSVNESGASDDVPFVTARDLLQALANILHMIHVDAEMIP